MKISIKMACVSRLFVSCDYAQMNIRNLTNLLHLRNYHFHSQNTVTKLAIMEVLELLLSNISEAVPVSKCGGLFFLTRTFVDFMLTNRTGIQF